VLRQFHRISVVERTFGADTKTGETREACNWDEIVSRSTLNAPERCSCCNEVDAAQQARSEEGRHVHIMYRKMGSKAEPSVGHMAPRLCTADVFAFYSYLRNFLHTSSKAA
jgi:hypothetical protein